MLSYQHVGWKKRFNPYVVIYLKHTSSSSSSYFAINITVRAIVPYVHEKDMKEIKKIKDWCKTKWKLRVRVVN
jgi:hypothetical protein